jgi:glucokinase
MKTTYLGVNIGGTNCSVSLCGADWRILRREAFATAGVRETIDRLKALAAGMVEAGTAAVGISCGGPLDAAAGVVLSPPNLPGWDRIEIVRELESATGKKAYLMNDANAGAVAEWLIGTGGTCSSLVFLTCGTGMGAGLILNGRLYEGASGDAGEVGHLRLTKDGPVGYGKAGSFEGWCSGGGFRQYAGMSAKDAAEAARRGDAKARAMFDEFGRKLGHGLAAIIDAFNPRRIVLGGIYLRAEDLIAPAMRETLALEALPQSLAVCEIARSVAGEDIGDLAALAVARYHAEADPLAALLRRFPELAGCRADIQAAADALWHGFKDGGKLLLCGNGGSWSDAHHIAGELLKSFKRKRPVTAAWAESLPAALRGKLEQGLPAVVLGAAGAFASAYANDVDAELILAQEVQGLGVAGDCFLGISTSGNARNVCAAATVARAKGLRVLGLTGQTGGALAPLCDVCIRVPERETYRIQELHLPVYHAICMMIEDRLVAAHAKLDHDEQQ